MSDRVGLQDIQIFNDWVFVERIEDKSMYGSIIVPEHAKAPSQKGRVVAIKKGDKDVKENDTVLFRDRDGYSQVEFEGVKYLAMRRSGILGVVDGTDAADVRALGDNVFLEWELAPSYIPGTNLIRPDNYREMYYTAIIRSVGSDVEGMKVGDRVFFDRFCGVQKFEEDGKRYAFVTSDDIYCKVTARLKKLVEEADYNGVVHKGSEALVGA